MLLITIILFLFNRSLRKKIQIHGLHDLSSLPLSSSPSRTPFLLDLLFFFFFVYFLMSEKFSRGESRRRCDVAKFRRWNVATLADVGCMSCDLNVTRLGRREVRTSRC